MLLLSPAFVSAQPTTAAAEASPAAVTPNTTVTDTVTQATASEELQRAALARLAQAGQWRDLEERVTVLEADLDALAAGAIAAAELIDPIDLDRQLRALHRAATSLVDDLASVVRRLEHDGNALESEVRKWQERLLFLEARLVPAPVLERARAIEARLQRASSRLREFRDSTLLALDRALALQARIDGARALIATRQERVRSHRMEVEKSALWQLGAAPAQFEHVAAELRAAGRVLRDYLMQERCRSCRSVLWCPGADRLAIRQGVRAGCRIGAARLRSTGRRIAAHRTHVAVVAGARSAVPVLRGAAGARPHSRGNGGTKGAGGAHSADALRNLAGHDAHPRAGRDRRECDCQSDAAAGAGDRHRRADRARPSPWTVAAGVAAPEPGYRARCSMVSSWPQRW